jgi:hypothetical protein
MIIAVNATAIINRMPILLNIIPEYQNLMTFYNLFFNLISN